VVDESFGYPSGSGGSAIWQDAFSRATLSGQTDFFAGAPGAGFWIDSPDQFMNRDKIVGDVWGFSNSDDPVGQATPVGDAPKLNTGAVVEAWWDPRN
jgi:hypothetical protein